MRRPSTASAAGPSSTAGPATREIRPEARSASRWPRTVLGCSPTASATCSTRTTSSAASMNSRTAARESPPASAGPGRAPRTAADPGQRPTDGLQGDRGALTGDVYHINTDIGINTGSMFDVVNKRCSVHLVTTRRGQHHGCTDRRRDPGSGGDRGTREGPGPGHLHLGLHPHVRRVADVRSAGHPHPHGVRAHRRPARMDHGGGRSSTARSGDCRPESSPTDRAAAR